MPEMPKKKNNNKKLIIIKKIKKINTISDHVQTYFRLTVFSALVFSDRHIFSW